MKGSVLMKMLKLFMIKKQVAKVERLQQFRPIGHGEEPSTDSATVEQFHQATNAEQN